MALYVADGIRERIEQLAASGRADHVLGLAHHWKLGAPWSEERVATFESRWDIRLPSSYRAFLVEVAASGAGPGGGLWAPGGQDDNAIDEATLALLKEPFPHAAAWNRDPAWIRDVLHAEDGAAWEEYYAPSWTRGALNIATLGCDVDVLVVVGGPQADRIWIDDRAGEAGIYPEDGLDFAGWYRAWLAAAEAKVATPPVVRTDPMRGRPAETLPLPDTLLVEKLRALVDAPGGTDLGALGGIGRHHGRAHWKQGPLLKELVKGAPLADESDAGRLLQAAVALARTGVAVAIADLFVLWLDEERARSGRDYLGRELHTPARPFLVITPA